MNKEQKIILIIGTMFLISGLFFFIYGLNNDKEITTKCYDRFSNNTFPLPKGRGIQ